MASGCFRVMTKRDTVTRGALIESSRKCSMEPRWFISSASHSHMLADALTKADCVSRHSFRVLWMCPSRDGVVGEHRFQRILVGMWFDTGRLCGCDLMLNWRCSVVFDAVPASFTKGAGQLVKVFLEEARAVSPSRLLVTEAGSRAGQ